MGPELMHRMTLLAMSIIPGVSVPFALGAPLKSYLYWLMPSAVYFLIWVVLPLIVHRKGTFEERWAADDEIDKSFEAPAKLFSSPIGLMIFLSLILTYAFYVSGETWAMSKKEFLVLKMSNQVMLIKNGDTMLFASFDPKTRIVSKDFHFMSVSQLASDQFTLKEIGPLIRQEDNQ